MILSFLFILLLSIKETNRKIKETYNINTFTTIYLIKDLNKATYKHFKSFLFSSSSHVYKPSFKKLSENSIRKPETVYGKSKKKVEDYIHKNRKKINFKIGVARIFNFYSRNHGKDFLFKILKKN